MTEPLVYHSVDKPYLGYEEYISNGRKYDSYFYLYVSIMVLFFYLLSRVSIYRVFMMIGISVCIACLIVREGRSRLYKYFWADYKRSKEMLLVTRYTLTQMGICYSYLENGVEKNVVFTVNDSDFFYYDKSLDVLFIRLRKDVADYDNEKSKRVELKNVFDCDLSVIFKDFL